MLILLAIILITDGLFIGGGQANNYDSYLADLALTNAALKEQYLEQRPRVQERLEKLYSHPSYGQSEELRDLSPAEWTRLQELLESIEQDNEEEPDLAFLMEEPQSSRSVRAVSDSKRLEEEMYQNQLTGKQKIVGGSSEAGAWFDYALQGAGAQDEDDEENDDEAASQSKTNKTVHHNKKPSGEKEDKLPAYCDPPNPCPIGYDPTKMPAPCDMGIIDSKQFNKQWINQKMANGECLCDQDHMKDCSKYSDIEHRGGKRDPDSPFMSGQKRSHLVAKKNSHAISKRSAHRAGSHSFNPYLNGQVLPRVTKKNGPKFTM